MRRFKKMEQTGAHGWTDWVQPTPRSYLMGCCDCGLVHELQFKVVKVTVKGGGWTERHGDADPAEFRSQFRARRRDTITNRRRAEDGE